MYTENSFIRAGFVCGIKSEERCLVDAGITNKILLSGARSERAEWQSQKLVKSGANLLISVGIAGGIDPDLVPGSIIIADRIIYASNSNDSIKTNESNSKDDSLGHKNSVLNSYKQLETDAVLNDIVAKVLPFRSRRGPMIGVGIPITKPGHKKEIFRQTSALACDMESHAVGKVAQSAGIPFVVIRVISDPSNRHIPVAAISCIKPTGRVSMARFFVAIASRPWDVQHLYHLGLDSRVAHRQLRCVARAIAPLFCGAGTNA